MNSGKGDGILPPRPDTHEIMTNSNRHEMSTTHNVPELDEHSSKKFVRAGKAKTAIPAQILPLETKRERAAAEELSTGHYLNDSSLSTEGHQDMKNVLADTPENLAPLSPREHPDRSNSPLMFHENVEMERETPKPGEEERKLNVLRDRIDRVREENERLERIQEPKDLQEQTKNEILEAQRRRL